MRMTRTSMSCFPTFRSLYGSSFGIRNMEPSVTETLTVGDLASFESCPLPIPMTISSSPGIHFVKSEPGASLTRVSINCERSTGALALLLLMPEAQLQLTADDATPQPQLPLGKI
jgi:hypothetical protein